MDAGKKDKPRESRHALFAKVETHRGYILRFSQAPAAPLQKRRGASRRRAFVTGPTNETCRSVV